MNIIPAVDVLDGRVVRLLKGDFDAVTTYDEDPVGVAAHWIALGAPIVHVVDLDAARTGTADPRLWAAFAAEGIPFQLGGGIRDAPSATHAIESGVARVVVGSAIVHHPDTLKCVVAAVGSERVVAAVDVRDGRARGSGWEDRGIAWEDAIDRVVSSGAGALLVTGIETDGTLAGPDLSLLSRVRAVAANVPLIASGGVAAIDDLRALEDIGCVSAIVGRALYDRTITFEDVVAHGFFSS
ncbi:MAG: 1-(5-phosphoribosyl)-5-[(5-phosphoribosylamino)methylideneamino] imidazole-4-carboxamide isomerase [Actinomycetia bacterium]|nr:1-(5-phosphoribosyl)-5-[(5-phosphoribosylamino)methylideneamino] imidazole-4-carboxamide isomerase [Actinomycetes bacterium]